MRATRDALRQRFFLDRLLAPVMTVVFIGVLVTTTVSYFYTKSTVEDLARSQTTLSLSFLDREITYHVRDMVSQTYLLTQEESLRLALEDTYLGRSARVAAQRKLEGRVQGGVFTRIYLMNTQGRIIMSSDPRLAGVLDVADRRYYRQALAGQPTLETVPVSRVSPGPILVSSAPVRGADWKVLGVVVGILDTEILARDLLSQVRFGSRGGAYIINSEGVTVASPSWAPDGHFAPGGHTTEILTLASTGGMMRYRHPDGPRLCAVQRNEDTGWVVVVEADEDEVLEPATRLAQVSGGISLFTLALVAVALGALRRVMARLRNSEADSRALSDLSPVGIVTADAHGRPVYLNQQARKILELAEEDPLPAALQMEDDQGVPLQDSDSPLHEVLEGQRSLNGRLVWFTPPSGARKALFLNATPLSRQGGAATGLMATMEDITERMQSLELLNQSEERFSTLFRLSPDSVLLSESESGIIVDVNDAFSDTFGYPRDEVVGRAVKELDLFLEDSQREAIKALLERDGYVRNAEVRGRVADGAEAAFSLSSQVMDIGEKSYRMTVVRDITERVQAMEELLASEERFVRAFNSSPAPMTLSDIATGRFLTVNDRWSEMLGYPQEELIGRTSKEVGIWADPAMRDQGLELLRDKDSFKDHPVEFVTKTGQRRSVLWSAEILNFEGQKVMLSLIYDITERKQAEEALRQSEERFSSLFRLSPDGIVLAVLETGVIVDVNEAFTTMHGLSREAAIGRTAEELHMFALDSQRVEFVEKVRQEGHVYNFEVLGHRVDGQVFNLSLSTQVIPVGGELYRMTVARDITEQVKAVEALRKSESFLSTLLESIPVPVFYKDAQERYSGCNSALEAFLGVDKEQLIGKSVYDLSPKELADVYHAKDAELLEGGGTQRYESSVQTRYAGPRTVIFHKAAYADSAGNVLGLVGAILDITDRKLSEEALRQSEEKLSKLFRLSPEAIFIVDLESGRITDVNEAFCDITGYAPKEVMGRTTVEIGLYADPASRAAVYELVRRDGHVENFEFEGRRKDSRTIICFLSCQIITIGESRCVMAMMRDVTERKRAEERLRQSEEKFSRLFLLSPDAIVLLHMDTSRLAEVNDAYVQLFGYSREELLGRTTLELDLYADPAKRSELFETMGREGHAENFEVECRRKDGSTMICALNCHILTIDGAPYMMSVLRDITETKKMQEMMIQTEKMISVGGIAAGIAHEINNPLGIVLQAAQNLVQRSRPDFQKNLETAAKLGLDMELFTAYLKARKLDVFIQDIQSAAIRASAIIRHMLDFSRRSESRRKVCQMPEIIDKAIDLASSDYDLKKSYDFKRITVVRDYGDDLPVVNCTETELEQVFLNLLRNAAQALSELDPPTQDPRIGIKVAGHGAWMRIEISDNGPGMPTEVQRRIFEPFFTTKPPGVGTGLGLSVSYFIITKGHGGRMKVSSQPGAGTVFTIDLPAEAAGEG